ncbi:MAG: MMPL family transporter [Dehalococcoidia bacterium]|nr:MMPL family transporter [Dehalococcoidia bacterium]
MNILERLVKATTRHPVKTVAIVLGITVLAAIPASNFTIDTSMEGYFESDDPDFLAAEAVEEQFGGSNMVVVVIDCSDSNAYTAKAYARTLAKKLEKDSRWEDVQYKKDFSFAAEKGILYLPEEQFAALMDPRAAPGMLEALPTATLEKATLSEYIVSDNKRIYLITMGFTIDMENPLERNYLLDDLGRLITETRGEDKDYEALNVGFTGGLMVIDYEGDKMAMQDIYLTAFITLILILILLFVSFRSLSLPLLSAIPLLIGIIWTSGVIFLVYDSLNALSAAFAVLLLGLGIDFCIHLLTRFMGEMEEHDNVTLAFEHTFVHTGRAVILGCLTTAAAFFSFYFAETKALHQLGVIGAIGLPLTLVAVFVLLPALVVLRLKFGRFKFKRTRFNILRVVGVQVQRFAPGILVILVALFVLFGIRAPSAKLSESMYELMPTEVETYQQLEKVKENFDYDPEQLTCVVKGQRELNRCVKEFQNVDGVLKVESILDYLPENQDQKLEAIKQAVRLHPELAIMPGIDVTPMSYKELPKEISRSWVSDEGEFLIRIIPDGDLYDKSYQRKLLADLREIHPNVTASAVLWTKLLTVMTTDVIRVSLMASGMLVLIVYFGTRRRSPVYALLSMVPVAFGVLGLLGTYQWFGANLNVSSISMIPLVIGIGIDDGIHIVHRYLEEGKGSLPQVIQLTGKAIFLTTATTCLAFSSFLFSSHPSMRSLSLIPIIGLSLCFFGAIVFLPALLRIIVDRRGIKGKEL